MSPTHGKTSNDNNAFWTAILYGLINTIMVTPISISFCSIIFRDAAFEAYMPKLVKLVLISCAIHQLCFSLFSSLPFAIGQVQDAGLIFLSAIAADIASRAEEERHIVPTTLYILGICTAILGVMLIIVAKLKLASMVQYLPMPVIGGYLAFIGFFCGEAGLAMMAGVRVANITEWGNFLDYKALFLLTPGVICGISTYMLLRKFRSPLILPLSLVFIFATFYGIMWGGGYTLEEAREYGWIAPLTPTGSTFEAWTLYNIYEVEWWHFPRQIVTLIAMFFVVAFSSSLDVAAIEMELGVPLDYNRELNTVGISNMISGLFGGYTGSYIFSQTIFTMRRGVTSRVCGYFVIAGEVIIALLPISITAYIPKMFFGSLLVLIATDLMFEWLWEARAKMMLSEYLVCLATFAAIQIYGIEIGMCIGILCAMTSFVVTYSKLQSVSAMTLKSSTVIRSYEERAVLLATRGKVLTISMGGYIFFGSAVKILEEIKSKLESNSTGPIPITPNSERAPSPSSSSSSFLHPSKLSSTTTSNQGRIDGVNTSAKGFLAMDSEEDDEEDTNSLQFHSTRSEKIFTNTNTNTNTNHSNTSHSNSISPSKGLSTDTTQQLSGSQPAPTTAPAAPATPSRYNMWMRTPKSNRKKALAVEFALSSPSPSKYDSVSEERKPLLYRSMSSNATTTSHTTTATAATSLSGYGGMATTSYQPQPQPSTTHLTHTSQQPLKFVYSSSPPTQSHIQHHMKTIYEMSPEEIKAQHDSYVHTLQQQQTSSTTATSTTPSKGAGAGGAGTGMLLQATGARGGILSRSNSDTQDIFGKDITVKKEEAAQAAATVEKELAVSKEDIESGNRTISATEQASEQAKYYQANAYLTAQLAKNHLPPTTTTTTTTNKHPVDTTNTNNDEWAVGDELNYSRHSINGGGGDAGLNRSNHSISGGQRLMMTGVYDTTTNTTNSTNMTMNSMNSMVKNSPSLLNLVWEGQQQRRGRLRSASDMGLDSSVHSVHRGGGIPSTTTTTTTATATNTTHIAGITSPKTQPPLLSSSSSQRVPTTTDFQPVLSSLNDPSALAMPPADSTIDGEQIIEYLVLDFSSVSGVDATAARSCFLSLVHLMKNADVMVVFANMTKPVEELLRAHHVIEEVSVVIPVLDDALEWCEDQLLTRYRTGPGGCLPKSSHLLQMNQLQHQQQQQQQQQIVSRGHDEYANAARRRQSLSSPILTNTSGGGGGLGSPPTTPSSVNLYAMTNEQNTGWDAAVMNPLSTILEDYLEITKDPMATENNPHHEYISQLLSPYILIQYFQKEIYSNHQLIFDIEELANKVYFIESGQVEIVSVSAYQDIIEPHSPLTPSSTTTTTTKPASSHAAVVRINKVATGGVFGESDFFLGRTHSVRACAVTETVIVWTLNKQQFIAMEIAHPQLCMLIQYTLLKSLSIASTCAMYALHPTTANAVHDI